MYFIDTNIFLEVELSQGRCEECKRFLGRVLSGEIEACTSDFNLESAAIVMDARKCKPDAISKFLLSVMAFEGLTIYSVNMIDSIVATKYMNKSGLSFDDAVTYFVAKSLDAQGIVSLDKDFDKVPGIKRMEPNDVGV